jgi:hypothetical protein
MSAGDPVRDPGQLGRLGHGRLAIEFFAQFVAALPELFDFHAEFFESGEMPAGSQG